MTVFLDASDFDKGLSLLHSASKRNRCAIHKYVLMDNHFHLLVTPSDEFGPSKFMQSVGDSYALYFNGKYDHTGTLWNGRYRSNLINSTKYFYDCSRYIELNPVRASMVTHPGEYIQSSFRRNALGIFDPLVTSHNLYDVLGDSEEERCIAYRQLFTRHLDPDVCENIRRANKTGETLTDKGAMDSSTP